MTVQESFAENLNHVGSGLDSELDRQDSGRVDRVGPAHAPGGQMEAVWL